MKKHLLILFLLLSSFSVVQSKPVYNYGFHRAVGYQVMTITSVTGSYPTYQVTNASNQAGNTVGVIATTVISCQLLTDGNRVVFKAGSDQYVFDVTVDMIVIDGVTYSQASSHVTGAQLQVKLMQLFPKANSSAGGSGVSASKYSTDSTVTAAYLVTSSTYTSGSTYTIPNNTGFVIVNPAATVASLTITMPASPLDGQKVEISFGGTVTSGDVITALTVSPNSGQTLLQVSNPSNVQAGETVSYRYKSSLTKWYRVL